MTDHSKPIVYREGFRRRKFVYRDAVSGQWVTRDYADANPNTTIRERVQ